MAYHTFEFLRKRRKDPKWRDQYINALLKRIFMVCLGILVILLVYLIDLYNIDVASYFESFINWVSSLVNGIIN